MRDGDQVDGVLVVPLPLRIVLEKVVEKLVGLQIRTHLADRGN